MAWKFNNESPIYLQIVDAIKMQIAQGTLKPGDQVPADAAVLQHCFHVVEVEAP